MKSPGYFIPAVALLVLFAGLMDAGGGQANFAVKGERTADWMRAAVEDRLRETFSPPINAWRIVEINLPPARAIPAGFDDYKLTTGNIAARGKTRNFVFNFYKNGKFIKRLNVVCRLELFADVVVANRAIKRGSVITGEILEIAQRKVSLPADDFCTEIAQVIGQQAKRSIRPGKPLHKSDLTPAPTIRSGEIVRIVAQNGNIKVTARGIAKSDGAMGQMIPVVSLRSNKKIFARVVGGGTVQVIF